jgi:hypothetical protein
MQDRYFGDIGDFAKLGLLRGIAENDPALRRGVLWYLVPDESHTKDGRHIAYLERSPKNLKSFRPCDPDLYDTLGKLVGRGKRAVSSVAENSLLPRGTLYHEGRIDYRGVSGGDRTIRRERWLAAAHQSVAPADVVFLDPDNGLEVRCGRYDLKGPKYAFYDDLIATSRAGKTIIVYQHANHSQSFSELIQSRFSALATQLGRPAETLRALRWRRVSARAFIFVLADGHRVAIVERLHAMLAGPWGAHFELILPGA